MPNPCVQFVSIQFGYACMYKMTSHNVEQINTLSEYNFDGYVCKSIE